MATKVSALDRTNLLNDEDLIYVVDGISGVPTSKGMTKANFKQTLGLSAGGSRLISGGMVWVSGLTYESVDLVYEINGEQFNITDGTQVTLDAAPTTATFKRIDLIYGDDTGALGISKGTEDPSPVANALDQSQLQLSLVILDTNATEPDGVSIRTVYTEDAGQPSEFDATENTGGLRIDLADTSAPITGTYSIKTIDTLLNGDFINLTHATDTLLANFSYIKFDIKNLADWGNDYITIKLFDAGSQVGFIALDSSNLSTDNIIDVQTVTIFKNNMFFSSVATKFNTILISNVIRGASGISYILDNIYIGEDEQATQPLNILASDISLDTTNFDTNLDASITDVQKLADAVDDLTTAAGSVDVVSNVDTNTILGRVTAGNGNSEELNPTQVRTLINVEDGATANDGTVTSVTVTGSDGIEVDSGSPITTSGTIALGLNAGTTKTFLKDRLLENATVTGSFALDYSLYELWNLTLTGATTFTESNLEEKCILIRCTGNFALTYPTNWLTDISGIYDGLVNNIIIVQYFKSGVYKVSIIQPDS